jgi:hypothetical protein
MIRVLTLFLFLLYFFSFTDSKQSINIMTYASVVSGAALASMAVAAASEVSTEDTAARNNWTLVGGPKSGGNLSNMDDTAVSGIKQVVVVTNYYQSLDKDDTPGEEDSVFSSIRNNEFKNI